jgi:2-polyprenyl-3-methyl-5-hydroxy-6-metoxy-1,4-benzoquinol methylase
MGDFFGFLKERVSGKSVLDCGAAGEEGIGKESPYWIHGCIVKSASYTLGFDLEEQAVRQLKEKGYNVVVGDCEKLELVTDKRFDIAFAGEIIEHLSRPGDFLEGLKKYLSDDGTLILTTPNAFSLFRFMGNVAGLNMENPQHVLVQNEETLRQLLERHGYKVVETHFFTSPSFYEQPRLKLLRKTGKVALWPVFWLRPQLSHQILMIAKMSGQ